VSMPLGLGEYIVSDVRGIDRTQAPPEIRERFEGRLFSLRELEERGVRIAGGEAWYTALAQPWRLLLDPALGTND
jgi:hypothetical protein